MKKILIGLSLLALSASASANFFGDNNNGEWKMGPYGPYWEENTWPEWTPMYWMEEMMNSFDDNNNNYGGNGFNMPFFGNNNGFFGNNNYRPYGGVPMMPYGAAPMPMPQMQPMPYGVAPMPMPMQPMPVPVPMTTAPGPSANIAQPANK